MHTFLCLIHKAKCKSPRIDQNYQRTNKMWMQMPRRDNRAKKQALQTQLA